MKIKFPIVIDIEDVINKIIQELSKSFEVSIPYIQEEIIRNLKEENVLQAINTIDSLRRHMAEMDFVLENCYKILLEYAKIKLGKDKLEATEEDNSLTNE